ncbi:hypothetical protein [Halorubellus litoreus]|uniref:Copper binding protein, plastocyanin/azurin family n=1 Tax=Halorubellus litoreus TaxID=755308 RepID=A0ABD5VB76_9EURY
MTAPTDVDELDLSDQELLTVLKNHGIDRRTLMKLFGVGAGVAALGGSAAGSSSRGNRIDEVYGASYDAELDTVPSGIVDHEVGMHVHPGDGAHEGFPPTQGEGEGEDGDQGDEDGENGEDGDQGEDGENGEDAVPEFFFDPVGLHVNLGDVVAFTTHGTGLHTITSFHPKWNEPPVLTFPDRVPTDYGFSSPPIATDDTWLYRFTTKGVYDLLCLPHVSFGMVMRIVVFDPEEDDVSEERFSEPAPDSEAPLPGAAATVLGDDALDPENVVDVGEVAWSALSLGSTESDDS